MANHAHATPEIPQAIAEPGLIIRLSQSLGSQSDVIQFEGFIDRDSEQGEINALCDKLVRAGARQRAKSELPGLRRQLEGVQHKTTENRARLASVIAAMNVYAEERKDRQLAKQLDHDRLLNEARDQHVASGRRGEFRPAAGMGGNLNRLKSEIEQLNGPTKEENEYLQQKSVLDNEIAEGNRAMAQLTTLIVENERLAKGEDISGVEG